ncbi:hypothetical protein H4Q32_000632 [Labeo rohita]|uniref:Uncharacterized protein n=1 Tax=Labeo rohita TaxID=84645 RepID=A0ABQ8LIU8_LABRO|nr:hypothetical protein H4Q32_000632 [Labeo rohita]
MDLPSLEAVLRLLNEGILCICNICKSLLDAQGGTSSMGSTIEQTLLRNLIEYAEQYLEERLEQLTKEKENAEQQNTQNATDKSVEIQKQRARQNTGKGVTIGGAVLAAIPIIGWIPGIIMMAVETSEIVKASNAIRDAENAREREIEELKQNLQFTADIQEMVRRAVNLLNVLKGRLAVVDRQTQSFIFWEPVKKAMEDVMKAAEKVAENRLVFGQNVSGLVNTLRENIEEILALIN